jgi:cytoskeletal protein CcmA (bactofilin family)
LTVFQGSLISDGVVIEEKSDIKDSIIGKAVPANGLFSSSFLDRGKHICM